MKTKDEEARNRKGFRASPRRASPMANRYLAAIQHQFPPEWPENDDPPRPPNLPQHAQFFKGEEKTVSTNSMTFSSRSADNHYYQLSPPGENRKTGWNCMNPSNQRDIMALLHHRRQLRKSPNLANNMQQHPHNPSPPRNRTTNHITYVDSVDKLQPQPTKLKNKPDPLCVTSPHHDCASNDKKSRLSLNFNPSQESAPTPNSKNAITLESPKMIKDKKQIRSVKDRISVFDKGPSKSSQGNQFKLNQQKHISTSIGSADNSSLQDKNVSSTAHTESERMAVGSSLLSSSKGKTRNDQSMDSTRHQDNILEGKTITQSNNIVQDSTETNIADTEQVFRVVNPWKTSQKYPTRNNPTAKITKQNFGVKTSQSNSSDTNRNVHSDGVGQNVLLKTDTAANKQVGDAVQTWRDALKKRNKSGIATTWRKNVEMINNNLPTYKTISCKGDSRDVKQTQILSPTFNENYDTKYQARENSPSLIKKSSNMRKKWDSNSNINNKFHSTKSVQKSNENDNSFGQEYSNSPKLCKNYETRFQSGKDSPNATKRDVHIGKLWESSNNRKNQDGNVSTWNRSPFKCSMNQPVNEAIIPEKLIFKENSDSANTESISADRDDLMEQEKNPKSEIASTLTLTAANSNSKKSISLYKKEPVWMIQRKSLKSIKNRTKKRIDEELDCTGNVESISKSVSNCCINGLPLTEGEKNLTDDKYEELTNQNSTTQQLSPDNIEENRQSSSIVSLSSNKCNEVINLNIISQSDNNQASKESSSKTHQQNESIAIDKKETSSIGVKSILQMFESTSMKSSQKKVSTQAYHNQQQNQTKLPFAHNMTYIEKNADQILSSDTNSKCGIDSKEKANESNSNTTDKKEYTSIYSSEIMSKKSERTLSSDSDVATSQFHIEKEEKMQETPSPSRLKSANNSQSFQKDNSCNTSVLGENDQYETLNEKFIEPSPGKSHQHLTPKNQQDVRNGLKEVDYPQINDQSAEKVGALSKIETNFSNQPQGKHNSISQCHTPSKEDDNSMSKADQCQSLAVTIKSPPRLNNTSSLAVNGDNYQQDLTFSPKSNFSNLRESFPMKEKPENSINNLSFMYPQHSNTSPNDKNTSFKLQVSNITGNSEHQIDVEPQNADFVSPNTGNFFGEDDDDDECDGVTLSPSTSEISALTNPSCIESSDGGSSSQFSSSDEDTRAAESADRQSSSVRGPSEASSSQTSEAATPLIHSTLGKLNFKIARTSSSETLDVLEETNPLPSTSIFQPLVDDNSDEVNQGLLLQRSHVQAPYREREIPATEDFSGDGSEFMTDFFSQVDNFPSVAGTTGIPESLESIFPTWNIDDCEVVKQSYKKDHHVDSIDWENWSQDYSEREKQSFEEYSIGGQVASTESQSVLVSKTSNLGDGSHSLKSPTILTSARTKSSKKMSEKRMAKINQLIKNREIVKDNDPSVRLNPVENRFFKSDVDDKNRKMNERMNRMFVRTHPFHSDDNANKTKIESDAINEINSSPQVNGIKKVTRDRKFQSGRAAHIVNLHLRGSAPNYSTEQTRSNNLQFKKVNDKSINHSTPSSFKDDYMKTNQDLSGNSQIPFCESRLTNRFSISKEIRKTRTSTQTSSPLNVAKKAATTMKSTELKQQVSNPRSYRLGEIARRARMTVSTKSSKASEALVSLVSPYSPKKNTQNQRHLKSTRRIKKDLQSRYNRLQMARSRSRTPVNQNEGSRTKLETKHPVLVEESGSCSDKKPNALLHSPRHLSMTTAKSCNKQDMHNQGSSSHHWSHRKPSPSPPPLYRNNAVNTSTFGVEGLTLSPNWYYKKELENITQSHDSKENEDVKARRHRSLTPSRKAILAARRDTEERTRMRLSNISLRNSPQSRTQTRENASNVFQSTARSSPKLRRLSGTQHSRNHSAESMQYKNGIPLLRSTSRERIINNLQRKRTGDRIGRIKSSSHV